MEIQRVCISFYMWRIVFSPTIDLFATRINTQLRTFVSYRPNPNCVAVNAFLINWEKEKFYAFLPFVCLSKTLQKIYQDKAKSILTALDWPSQPFYPRLIEIVSVPPSKNKLVSTKPTFNTLPTSQKIITASLLSRWGNDALTKDAEDLIINSWADKTRKQYRTYIGQWKEFCQYRNFSLTNASISEGSELLFKLYKKELS